MISGAPDLNPLPVLTERYFYTMNSTTGKYVIIFGLIVVIIGVIIYFFGNRLGFLGRLPGDIRIEGERGSFYFPVVTCILLSILISVIIRVVQWLLGR